MFRGAEYNITVRNPSRVECGVREVTIDGSPGRKTDGTRHATLPVFPPGTAHTIGIVLGRA